MWRPLGFVIALGLSGAGLAQTTPEEPPQTTAQPRDLQPLEKRIDRPFVIRLWQSNRAFLEINFLGLDAKNKALEPTPATQDIFDVDVFVMFLDSFAKPTGLEAHMLGPMVQRQLALAKPGETLRMFGVPLTRNPDGAQKRLNVILVETAGLRDVSDLCLSVTLYDIARWAFSAPLQLAGPFAFGRSRACVQENWAGVQDALAAEITPPEEE